MCPFPWTSSKRPISRRSFRNRAHRPARISKYATGMALLHPELPANRWYRTLTHELAGLFGTDRSSLECLNAA